MSCLFDPQASILLSGVKAKGVEWVAFDPDSVRLFAGNGDGSVHIWYPDPTGDRGDHEVLTGHQKKISALAMVRNGSYVVTASYDGTARVWPMRPPEMIKLGCYITGRGPTEAEWGEWLPGATFKPICG